MSQVDSQDDHLMRNGRPDDICRDREKMYLFFSRIFACEMDTGLIEQVERICQKAVQKNTDTKDACQKILQFVQNAGERLLIDLAEDFAGTFLGAGMLENKAAFPYASVYTSKKRLIMQDIWNQISEIYKNENIGFSGEAPELMEDHISCELEYMAYLCSHESSEPEAWTGKEQEFLEKYLLNWITQFCHDVAAYAKTEMYRGMAVLLEDYVHMDYRYILQRKEDAANHKEEQADQSYILSGLSWKEVFERMKGVYDIYAPGRISRIQENGIVRYKKIQCPEEIVWDTKAGFSPKEVYYPVSQTMLYFSEKEVYRNMDTEPRRMLVFMRPCDIHAMLRLDRIFLENGGKEDGFYARFREKVKIVMMECTESFDECFCVSMKSNITGDYDMAVRMKPDEIKVHVKDSSLLKYFSKEKQTPFYPEFVRENKKEIQIEKIRDKDLLRLAGELDFWKQYNERCIGCGGCNTVCGSCSCFDTVDIIYNESGKEGERRRVWSSCMLDDYTLTAGGNRTRKTQAENMRFKTFHKLYDYSMRFQADEYMCVGCGRCTEKCPQDIDFFDTISTLNTKIKQIQKERVTDDAAI